MADLIIRGMEMPKTGDHPFIVWVHPTGEATIYKYAVGAGYGMYTDSSEVMKATAVPLPAGHGRLIDADALLSVLDILKDKGCDGPVWDQMQDIVASMVTIVPAEGGTDNG